jgi:hypothetical protein
MFVRVVFVIEGKGKLHQRIAGTTHQALFGATQMEPVSVSSEIWREG